MVLSLNHTGTQVTEFLMICFPGMQETQHWLSLVLAPLLVLALGANFLLLLAIWQEASLHEPMYYLLAILSVLDVILCLTVIPKLSCGDIHLNKLYQFVSVWCLLGSDLVLILLSYCFILSAVVHLQSGGATTKALSTCGSHLILILFFYTLLLVFIFTNKAGKKVSPEVPILLNVLHHLIPPALNPIVYGVRTQEIKQGIIKLFKYQC
ncbi:hypothetical protein Celaphus_00009148, partial [Cervus elaphus hippelaphus]